MPPLRDTTSRQVLRQLPAMRLATSWAVFDARMLRMRSLKAALARGSRVEVLKFLRLSSHFGTQQCEVSLLHSTFRGPCFLTGCNVHQVQAVGRCESQLQYQSPLGPLKGTQRHCVMSLGAMRLSNLTWRPLQSNRLVVRLTDMLGWLRWGGTDVIPRSTPGKKFRHTEGLINKHIPRRSGVAAGPIYVSSVAVVNFRNRIPILIYNVLGRELL